MDGARERVREEASGGRREQRSDGDEQGRSVRGRKIGKDVNFNGGSLNRTLASIQYTEHKTTHNAALAIATL